MIEHIAAAWIGIKSAVNLSASVVASSLATVAVTESTGVSLGIVGAICASLITAAVTVVCVAVWLEHRFTSLEKGQDAINSRLDGLPCGETKRCHK